MSLNLEEALVHDMNELKGSTAHIKITRHSFDTYSKWKICFTFGPVIVGPFYSFFCPLVKLGSRGKTHRLCAHLLPPHSPDPHPVGGCQMRREMRRGWSDGDVALGNVEAQVGILK